jgi:hypothetical protein
LADNQRIKNSTIMMIKIISAALLLFSVYMGLTHGIQALNFKPGTAAQGENLLEKMDLSTEVIKGIGILTILGALLVLFPQTYLAGNFLNALTILFLMIQFIHIRAMKPALLEIPFLLIPLVMVYLRHPLRN